VETRERGLSLEELMVAMVVTLIIGGAVIQLITAGPSSLRKEPAPADRQQDIRMAIDVISQDLFKAGRGVPEFAQVFTRGLNATGPMGSGGAEADQLEMVVAADCGALSVCGVSSPTIFTLEPPGSCFTLPTTIVAACDTGANCPTYDVYWADAEGSGAGCGPGRLNLPSHYPVITPPGGKPTFVPQRVMVGGVVRYRVNPGAGGVPSLERSALGGANDRAGNPSWQILARGIEDLQVQYETGPAGATVWSDDPGPTSDIDTIVRRVRVRLSARSAEETLAGPSTRPAGGDAGRGALEVAVAPRAAKTRIGTSAGAL
jgi:hypothetical protein